MLTILSTLSSIVKVGKFLQMIRHINNLSWSALAPMNMLFIIAIARQKIHRRRYAQLLRKTLRHLLMHSSSGMDIGICGKVVIAVTEPGLYVFRCVS